MQLLHGLLQELCPQLPSGCRQASCAAHCIYQTYCNWVGRCPVQQQVRQGRVGITDMYMYIRSRGGAHPQSMILEASHPVFSSREFLTLPLRLPTIPPPVRLLALLPCLCIRAPAPCLLLLTRFCLHFVHLLALGCLFRAALSSCRACKHNLGSICRAVPSLPCPSGP